MADNQYLSRYARHDTRFHRTDPTPWIPLADEEEPSIARLLAETGVVFLVIVALLAIGWALS